MKITWTLCSERMPPDDDQMFVIGLNTLTQRKIKIMANLFHRLAQSNGIEDRLWTEFTKEKWEFLNR